MTKSKGTKEIDTPLKGRISRHYQKLCGDGVRGAALGDGTGVQAWGKWRCGAS